MNRFRTRKRAKDDNSAPRPSAESESSGPFRMFGRKKSHDEPKQDLNIAAALPSSDDFRTSLLMNGLSARFSMLREQDDPNTKLGKASDDSVLFPKRQSRMDLAFSGGLHDIAEVESIRAPFARMDSYQSDDASSLSGSIMNRPKPTDGNNLFGGRQKIYKITPGGNGRALYEDDVAQSAFQRWRQADREQSSVEDDTANALLDTDHLSTFSPQLDFNRRRETGSTTSSGPRSSTAATSVASSSLGPSAKDWQSTPATTPNTTSPNPTAIPERTVTRTRRLYEQGLNQDMQDHQSSASSRFDTISKQRPLGSRTPDLNRNTPSPTTTAFVDRTADRRPLAAKASAPNLRTFSPPVSNSVSPAEAGTKFPGLEPRSGFGASPPLSPPVSEAEDHPTLAIQPNDKGKATALGVFSRPSQQYDESKYAQRQRQLQQGRETPPSRFRAESNVSVPTTRSRSSSSLQRLPTERSEAPTLRTEPTVQEESPSKTFIDDSDDGAQAPPPNGQDQARAPQLTLERPDDQEHPAFRRSAVPTPLSLSRASNERPPVPQSREDSAANTRTTSPEDSPTLGPTTSVTAGLSGMVRQHLRNDSTASSVYGAAPPDEPEWPGTTNNSSSAGPGDVKSNLWRLSEVEHSPYETGSGLSTMEAPEEPPSPPTRESPPRPVALPRASAGGDGDDFQRHLADGARRVRERLTSYVDAEGAAAAGPMLAQPDLASDLAPPPRPSTLSSLRSKSSIGSLIDRSRENSQTRAAKRLPSAKSMADEGYPAQNTSPKAEKQQDVAARLSEDKEENVHAGLKAFRQARRELQRMKNEEVRQRHQGPSKTGGRERAPTLQAPSQERGPPPVAYHRTPSDEYAKAPGSRSASQAPSDRERSGSGASNPAPPASREGYVRTPSSSQEEHIGPYGIPLQGSGMRSPSMTRGPEGAPSPSLYNRSESAQGHHGMPYSGSGSGTSTPDGGRRSIRKGDISSPTFVSTTSQVPTFGIEGHQNGRPRNGSQLGAAASTPNLRAGISGIAAPPLPPINPRRKNGGGFSRQNEDEGASSSPHLPLSPSRGHNSGARGLVQMSDDDDAFDRQRPGPRKMASDGAGIRSHGIHNSPPQPTNRPPPPPATMPTTTLPGGMF